MSGGWGGGNLPWINLADFGPKADGASDDSAVFARALLAAAGGHLIVPPGAYVASGLAIASPTTIWGSGGAKTSPRTLIRNPSATLPVFTATAPGCRFAGFQLANTNAAPPTAGAGIVVAAGAASGDHALYEDVSILNHYRGFDIGYGAEWRMAGCYVYNPVVDAYRFANANATDGGDQSIEGCWATAGPQTTIADAAGFRMLSGGGTKIVNCKVNLGPIGLGPTPFRNGILLDVQTNVATGDLLIANCSVENTRFHGMAFVTAANPSTFRKIIINGCQLDNALGAPDNTGRGIIFAPTTLNDIQQVEIVGCLFAHTGSTKTAIEWNGVAHGSVTACRQTGYIGMSVTQGGSTDIIVTASP